MDESTENDRPLLSAAVEDQPARRIAHPPLPSFEECHEAIALAVEDQQRRGSYLQYVWIHVRFATPTSRQTFLRRMSRSIGGNILHVEVMFQDNHKYCYAYTVDLKDPKKPGSGKVRRYDVDRATAYPSARWHSFRLDKLTLVEVAALNFYYDRQLDKDMNAFGLYVNFVIPRWMIRRSRIEERKVFCSQLVTLGFKWVMARKFRRVNANATTPSRLAAILESDSETFGPGDFRSVEGLDI